MDKRLVCHDSWRALDRRERSGVTKRLGKSRMAHCTWPENGLKLVVVDNALRCPSKATDFPYAQGTGGAS